LIYGLKNKVEVSFSPPNLKRIGYPKNTIYMTRDFCISEDEEQTELNKMLDSNGEIQAIRKYPKKIGMHFHEEIK
jgi:hypothetical protein